MIDSWWYFGSFTYFKKIYEQMGMWFQVVFPIQNRSKVWFSINQKKNTYLENQENYTEIILSVKLSNCTSDLLIPI